jgi:hypothetical protein
MRVTRRDILTTVPQAAFKAAPTVHAVGGPRGLVSLPLAR